MIFDLPPRTQGDSPRKMPPRSMSTPYNITNHTKPTQRETNILNFAETNDSVLDSFSPEDQALLRELEATETSELNSNLANILEKQIELNRRVEQSMNKFTETIQQAQDLIPYLTDSTNKYQEAQEIAANISAIKQFRNLDAADLTPKNTSLFE